MPLVPLRVEKAYAVVAATATVAAARRRDDDAFDMVRGRGRLTLLDGPKKRGRSEYLSYLLLHYTLELKFLRHVKVMRTRKK